VSEVLYRKWRPQSFAEVAGQEPVTRTLQNSVASGRLAHAYLLCGPRGTGKTSLGRLLAKAANCASPAEGEPCNQCQSCLAFIEGRAVDFIEQDAASHNSVDDIRQLRENVILTPMSGGRKVYLLDEVHMLSNAAENALLKTLEEPPPHIIFVLATTDPHKVSATIISRCQRFDLRRIPAAAVIQRLAQVCAAEGLSLDEASLEEIARASTGSLRDAINALEQVVTYYGKTPSLEQVQEALGLRVDERSGELARLALAGDLPGGLRLLAAVRDDGVDMRQFAKQVTGYLRGLLMAKSGVMEAIDLPGEMADEVKREAAGLDRDEIVRALRTFGRADFRDDPSAWGGSLPIELALIDLTTGQRGPSAAPAPQPKASAKPKSQSRAPAAEMDNAATAPTPASLEPEPPPEEPAPREAPMRDGNAGTDLLEQVRQACKATDKQLSALLNGSCEVQSAEGDRVVLAFYHTFHLERVENGPFAHRLQELFSEALGRPVKVAFEHGPRQRTQAPSKGGHLVQAAKELGAKPVNPGE
jgi:DNA polymerase-3 subunit gamma/tau